MAVPVKTFDLPSLERTQSSVILERRLMRAMAFGVCAKRTSSGRPASLFAAAVDFFEDDDYPRWEETIPFSLPPPMANDKPQI